MEDKEALGGSIQMDLWERVFASHVLVSNSRVERMMCGVAVRQLLSSVASVF